MTYDPYSYIEKDNNNSTTDILASGSTFTGAPTLVDRFPSVGAVIATDQNGTIYFEFSPDGTNWDTSLSFSYDTARINPPHQFSVLGRYFRIRFTNTSASDQTYLRIQVALGVTSQLTAPINGLLAENYDATVVRPTDYISEVAMDKRQGRQVWNKFGFNLDCDIGSEIIASWGGAFDPTNDIITTAQTFNIAYDGTAGGSTDGAGTTGATQLLIYYIDEDFLQQTAVHVFGTDGSDTTSFTGLGINRVIVFANGGAGYNVSDITITATTDGTTQAEVPAQGSVTQQCIFHTQINHKFLADYLRFKILKPSGGGTGNGFIIGYSWSRVTNTRYEVFREAYATTSNTDQVIELKPSQKFVVGGREVLYFVIQVDSGNNTVCSGRFSGIEERVN